MSIFSTIISGAIGQVRGIIDELKVDDVEKMGAKAALLAIQADVTTKVLEYESTLAKEQGQTVRAEATGHSWLQRNWRPIIMLLFGYIVAHNYVIAPVFGTQLVEIPTDMWQLLKIGLGGYVIGRSAEKIVPATVAAMKKREET